MRRTVFVNLLAVVLFAGLGVAGVDVRAAAAEPPATLDDKRVDEEKEAA